MYLEPHQAQNVAKGLRIAETKKPLSPCAMRTQSVSGSFDLQQVSRRSLEFLPMSSETDPSLSGRNWDSKGFAGYFSYRAELHSFNA